MTIHIVFINRLEKVLGTLIKIFSYLFHFVFRQKRFTIPKHSKPLFHSKTTTIIPKIIWQTNYSNIVTLPVYINYLFNRVISPDYEYRYVSTEERIEFLKVHATKKEFEAFMKLTDGASQADFWRLFVLNSIGGVYLDIDAHAVWPLSKIIKPEYTHLFLMTRYHNYSNYFIASAKNNPYLKKTLKIIISNIVNKKIGDGGVYDLTGPATLNIAIGDEKINHRYGRITCIQGNFTNEYFQYLDKPNGKWTHVDKESLLK